MGLIFTGIGEWRDQAEDAAGLADITCAAQVASDTLEGVTND